MTLHPASKFRAFASVVVWTVSGTYEYAGLVDLVVNPEHSESMVLIPSPAELSLVFLPEHGESRVLAEAGETILVVLPEHGESRVLAEAGETILVVLPEHSESIGLIFSGGVSVNIDVTAELSSSLGILSDLAFSLMPESIAIKTSLSEIFNKYNAILYMDSVTATLTKVSPLARERVLA